MKFFLIPFCFQTMSRKTRRGARSVFKYVSTPSPKSDTLIERKRIGITLWAVAFILYPTAGICQIRIGTVCAKWTIKNDPKNPWLEDKQLAMDAIACGGHKIQTIQIPNFPDSISLEPNTSVVVRYVKEEKPVYLREDSGNPGEVTTVTCYGPLPNPDFKTPNCLIDTRVNPTH